VQIYIDDLKQEAEARIRFLFTQCSQEIRDQIDLKVDREYFKRQLDQRAKESEFKKAREELVWLKSFCHYELQGMIHKVSEEVRLQNIALV
jgi:hypothetical protein